MWTIPAIVLVVVATSLGWSIYEEYNETLDQEYHYLEVHARIADAYLSGLLRNIEQLLSRVAEERPAVRPEQSDAYAATLAVRLRNFPELRSLLVIDANGRVELADDPLLKGFDASTSDYFTVHATGVESSRLFISRPFKTNGQNSLAFSVPMFDARHRFLGVVAGCVSSDIFDAIVRSVMSEGDGGASAVFNRHGDVLYRLPDPERYFGASLLNLDGGAPLRQFLASGEKPLRHMSVALDGVSRIYVFRQIGDTTLAVANSHPIDDALISWRHNVIFRALLFVFTAVVTLSLSGIAHHRQRALRASERRFRDMVNTVDGIVWEANALTFNFVYVSEKAERLLGYAVEEWRKPGFWLNHIHPDDRAWAGQFCASRTALLEAHDFEYRFIAKDGSIVWLHDLVIVVVENDKPKWLRGIMVDITARKRAEEGLRLAAMVYQNSSEAMMLTDAQNRIIAVNPAFTEVTGYTLDEVKGEDPRLLSSGRQSRSFFQSMWQSIRNTGRWQGELWNRRKSGEEFAERLTIDTIYSEDGTPQCRVALFSDISSKKESEELIWRQANFDSLTGLPNRHMLHDRLEQEIKKAHRTGMRMALLFIDLDRFKEVNDTLGHEMGDVLLKEAAQRLRGCVREADTVARLGGDEFTVILGELDASAVVERTAQEILRKLVVPFQLGEEVAYISASIGITLYPDDSTTIEDLLKNADQAMYAAKGLGRNRASYFTASMQESAQARMRLISDLRGALADRQFRIHFQPIVELTTGRIDKAEALIRWQHPRRGLIGPNEFIPLAEETGLIHDIGDWVLKESATWVKRWRARHNGDLQLSVNMSPVQFHRDDVSRADWLAHLATLDFPKQSLCVEITEGLLLNADPGVVKTLLDLRSTGVRVAIDDFGTGYSSLAYLKKFDIDYLKIDQSFTRNLAAGSSDLALSEAIIVMAHKVGLKVIAEGVETEDQRNLLAAVGCDYAQGYLFAQPMSAERFEIMLARHEADADLSSAITG